MFWTWDVTIPANTLENNPYTKRLKVSQGVIVGIWIAFRAGCQGQVKVRILLNDFKLIPLSPSSWLTGDNEIVQTETYKTISGEPAELKLVACSDGTTYDHEISVRIAVVPEIIASYAPLFNLLTRFLRRIGA